MPSAVLNITQLWPMSFTSVHFLLFLPVCAGVYFLLPASVRRPWLLLASYWFYFFAAPRYFVVLLCGTLLSYLLGLLIGAAKTPGKKRGWLIVSVGLLVLGLCFFKYNDYFAAFLSPLFENAGVHYPADYFVAQSALGISFYTFTAIGYLIDTARGDVPAEKNLLNYALFIGFFAHVTMGPISRAGSLLPQLKDDGRRFDTAALPANLRLLAVGYFKKLAVADTLAIFTGQIYGDLASYQGLTLTLAAIAFALQLYFDFSGYSTIAVASARLLGIQLPQNFQNPYFSTNFSAFWQRWHISLSTFLQDYIFTPVVWSRFTEKLPVIGRRVTRPPVLSAIAATFLVSGVWHGDTFCFFVWGALQAVFRIGEELLHRRIGKPKKNPGFAVRCGKTAVVLVLWVESLVFFKVGMTPGGTVQSALGALQRQFAPQGIAAAANNVFGAVQAGFYNDGRIAAAFIAFSLFCLALALWADWAEAFRLPGKNIAEGITAFPAAVRWLCYFILVLGSFAGFIAVSGGFGGASFLYGGF